MVRIQTDGASQMICKINGKIFKVKQTGKKFFYWSTRALRWLPIAKEKVVF